MYRAWPSTKGMLLAAAEIGQPVPGEHALDADDQSFAVQADRVEEVVGPAGQVAVNERFARLVDDADVHRLGMQIDAAIESVLLLCRISSWSSVEGLAVEPALEHWTPRSAPASPRASPINLGRRLRWKRRP